MGENAGTILSNQGEPCPVKVTVLSASNSSLGIFGRKGSGKPTVAGFVSHLSTTTISSSPVSWWCYWPSSCTFCGYAGSTTDKLARQPHWTCCGLKRWCRWGHEAGPELDKLKYPQPCFSVTSSTFLVLASDAALLDLVDIFPWNFYF